MQKAIILHPSFSPMVSPGLADCCLTLAPYSFTENPHLCPIQTLQAFTAATAALWQHLSILSFQHFHEEVKIQSHPCCTWAPGEI